MRLDTLMKSVNMSSRLEINFKRLLHRCEAIASDREAWDWRFEKYVDALSGNLGDIKRAPDKPTQDVITEFARRVDFLKGLLEAEQKPTLNEKVIAMERLAPVTHTQSPTSVAPKEVHLHTKTRLQNDMRAELLGDNAVDDKTDDTGVRQRKAQTETDIDTVLQHQRKVHEKLAEELLHHTYNLKDFAYASNALVKKDVEKLSDTNQLADKNYKNLSIQSQRLEAKTKSCSWWIWIMLVLVTLTFLSMIVLMRMLPKS